MVTYNRLKAQKKPPSKNQKYDADKTKQANEKCYKTSNGRKPGSCRNEHISLNNNRQHSTVSDDNVNCTEADELLSASQNVQTSSGRLCASV